VFELAASELIGESGSQRSNGATEDETEACDRPASRV